MSNPSPPEAAPVAKSGRPTKLIAVAVIGAIIVVECVVAALYLPFPSKSGGGQAHAAETKGHEAAAKGDGHGESGHGKPAAGHGKPAGHGGHGGHDDGHGDGHDAEVDPNDHVEVDLGDYRISSFQTSTNITLRIEFKLHATVLASQQPEFERLFGQRKNRVRDLVNGVIREASMNDLNEPGLGLIKRKVLETVNQSLGQPLLQSVVFGEFTFLEQ